MSEHDDVSRQVDRIATEIVAPNAARIDKTGEFPSAALAALGEAGLLGLISAEAVGGRGLAMRRAAQVVERLARECAWYAARSPPGGT